MATIPILLDVSPRYLGGGADSLLLLPTGAGTLLREVQEALAAVTRHAPLVLPLFDRTASYELAIRASASAPLELIDLGTLRDPLSRFEPSDQLLIISLECYPAEGLDLRPLLDGHANDQRMLRHLLAFESTSLGTKEYVQPGADGRVRRIQRYFEPVTWPFPAGVIASLVPVSCVLTGPAARWRSLAELRMEMAGRGVPAQDVPFHGHFFHLDDEAAALGLAERRVLELTRSQETRRVGGAEPVVVGHGVVVHDSARLVGSIVLGEGVEIGPDALIIGPALLGAGARIEREGVVAQCLVGSGAVVPEGATVRHRVVGAGAGATQQQRRHARPALATLEEPAMHTTYARIKDAVEPVLALLVIVALLPFFALAALMVLLSSRGPIFYGDPREGKDGRPFRCWKFRSMRTDADVMQRALARQQEMDGPQFKMADDPRVTAVGRWLRRLNLDELPQLWNIVRGEMSFVGPRPSPFRENQICVPWRHGRLSVRPGITGLWQVCRRDRASGDFHQWIHYDLLYVRHASFAVDARIFLATLITLGGRRPVELETIIPGSEATLRASGAPRTPRTTPARPMPVIAPDATPLRPTPTTSAAVAPLGESAGSADGRERPRLVKS